MIKHYSVFAHWRKKDIDFLNSLPLSRNIEEGADGFLIEEGEIFEKIHMQFLKKGTLFRKVKPPEFSLELSLVTFLKQELEQANYYMLAYTGQPMGYPEPKNENYRELTFQSDNSKCHNNKKQIAPFRIKKPNWRKNQCSFTLNWEPDFMFFKKDFFEETLRPLGLSSKKVIIHSTGEVSNDTVQLDIPNAKSELLIENTPFDIHDLKETCGQKQYALQILDFFPSFKKDFDFLICKTQEEFFGGRRRIIVSKEFCELLVQCKIIKFDSNNLVPMSKL